MTDSPNADNVEKFRNRVQNVIDVARIEGDVGYAEVIGILELMKLDLYQEMLEEDEELKTE